MQFMFLFILLISIALSFLSIIYYIFNLSARKNKQIKSINVNIDNVTAIVPVYNEKPRIFERTISSLYREHVKFIVIGDASSEPYRKITEKYGGTFIYKKEHCGKRKALAHGALLVQSTYTLFVDSDTTLSKNSVKKMLGGFTDDIGGVGARIKVHTKNNRIIPYALEFFQRLKEFGFLKIESLGMPMVLDGECAMYRTDIIKEYMQSDEYKNGIILGKKTFYADDRQLTAHILDLGYKAIRINEAIAITEAPTDIRKMLKQALRWSRAGYMYFFKELLDGTYLRKRPLFYFFQMTYMYIFPLLSILLIILRGSIYIKRGVSTLSGEFGRIINIFSSTHTVYTIILVLSIISYIATIFYVYRLTKTIQNKRIKTLTAGGIYMAMLFLVSIYGFLTFWNEKWDR